MNRVKTDSGILIVLAFGIMIIGSMLLAGCQTAPVLGAPVDSARLTDGTYEGSYRGGPNKAVVKVTIKDHAIADIEIVEHQAWKGHKAETPVVERIIANQSTRVDAVSGATNSSNVIMDAVQNAIEKAYRNE
jgi:uncharacterized protein with FMN-binding domain